MISPRRHHQTGKKSGFTIVELLIVIVVIGILAAITIIAYNGIQNRARASTAQGDLASAGKLLELYNVDNSAYPQSLSSLNNNQGFTPSSGTALTYQLGSTSNATSFCLVAVNGSQTYSISDQSKNPILGACSSFNYALNPSTETDTSSWGATSGAAIERVNTYAIDGNYSLRAYSNGSGTDRYVYQTVPVSGAGPWAATARVYLTNNATSDYSRGFWVNDNVNASSAAYNLTSLNTWQTVSRTLTATSSATSIMLRFYVMPGYNIYIDNITVTKA